MDPPFSLSSKMIADEEEVNRLDVSHGGGVMFTRPLIDESPCHVDMTNFPYDVQTCTLRFGSWMYTKEELDLVGDKRFLKTSFVLPFFFIVF